jgi:hypothetical protein
MQYEATSPPGAAALQCLQWPEAPHLVPAHLVEARCPWGGAQLGVDNYPFRSIYSSL